MPRPNFSDDSRKRAIRRALLFASQSCLANFSGSSTPPQFYHYGVRVPDKTPRAPGRLSDFDQHQTVVPIRDSEEQAPSQNSQESRLLQSRCSRNSCAPSEVVAIAPRAAEILADLGVAINHGHFLQAGARVSLKRVRPNRLREQKPRDFDRFGPSR